ncbi:hypothetical protein KKD70_00940 [Patescibacteria group bacterium]|nr:hypothetical protein [Patescibacteria group bacterium]
MARKTATPHKKALKIAKRAFIALFLVYLMASAVFEYVNPARIGGRGIPPEKTFSEPFVCTEWLGLGEGTYDKYCDVFTFLFGFSDIIKTIFLTGVLSIVCILIYLFALAIFEQKQSKNEN